MTDKIPQPSPLPPPDPVTSIEDQKAFGDMGRMGYFILTGAMESGASWVEGIAVVAAYFQGMFKGTLDTDGRE